MPAPFDTSDPNRLARTFNGKVQPHWIDYNGHMSEAFYVLIFGYATDELYEQLGIGDAYRQQQQCSVYTVEAHINYLQEVGQGEAVEVSTQLLERNDKTLRFCHSMIHGESGEQLAFTELLVVFVDKVSGRAMKFPDEIHHAMAAMLHQHQSHATPPLVQRRVGQR